MIIWAKLGTHSSQTVKVLRRRKAPEVGDRFEVVPTAGGQGYHEPIPVLVTEIKTMGEAKLYMLELF